MTFQPLTNYAGYNHIPVAGAVWFHPKNGNAYCCACEKDPSRRQDLSVYRMRKGAASWQLVKRYEGGQASEQQVTMGGAAIDQDGSLLVVTSLIIPGAPYITTEKFQGSWIREPNIDEPWSGSGSGEPGPPGPAGAGGVVLFPAVVTNAAWEAHALAGGVLVDIPAVFGVPSASSYLVRFTVNAPLANVRGRAGTIACPYFFTVNSQVAGVDEMQQGWVPGPECYISPAQGTPKVWMQLVGYST